MKKSTQLFIRGCKSMDPKNRVPKVYEKFYGKNSHPNNHIISILCDICDEFLDIKLSSVISNLSPNNMLTKYQGYDYDEVCLSMLISKIRISEVSKFTGYIIPMRFRD